MKITNRKAIPKIYTAYVRIDEVGADTAYRALRAMCIDVDIARTISRRKALPFPLSTLCDAAYPITERELVMFARQGIFPRFNITRFARPTPEAIEATNTHTLGDTSPDWISDGLSRSLRRMFPYFPHFTYGMHTTVKALRERMVNTAHDRHDADMDTDPVAHTVNF